MGSNDTYNIIKKDGNSEIVVTKSKFIGFLGSVSTVVEAEEVINRIRKKYNDARHNCYAYIIMEAIISSRKPPMTVSLRELREGPCLQLWRARSL